VAGSHSETADHVAQRVGHFAQELQHRSRGVFPFYSAPGSMNAILLLVVEDDHAGRYVKARTLRAAGFDVLEAA
jgi:hypothetical protein